MIMKYLRTFEKYAEADPINFENVFKLNDVAISSVLGDLLDKYIYLKFDINTNDYKKFKIEIYEDGLEADPTQNLDDEYKFFKSNVLSRLKDYFDAFNLKVDNERYNKGSNKIEINVSKIKV
jgi:hypothetical protein